MLHSPVMLEESIDFLITNPSGLYIDATFGRGGHSRKILDSISKDGMLLAIDKDDEAIRFAKENFKDLFKQKFDLTEAMSELLVNRNFNIEELSNFFDPKIKNLMPDPLVLKDMDKTINRLLKAILDKETIGIFGDYDVMVRAHLL